MELEKYIDKKKALDYIVREANRQEISLNTLCKGVYDSSNFYKMCNGSSKREISYDKLLILCNKLNISYKDLVDNCVLDDVTLKDELDKLREYSYLQDYESLKRATIRLRRKIKEPLPEIEQYLLWNESIATAEVDKDYDLALEKSLQAIHITIPDFEIGSMKDYIFREDELSIYNTILLILSFSQKDHKMVMNEYRRLIRCVENRTYSNHETVAGIYYNAALQAYRAKETDIMDIVDIGINYCLKKHAYLYLPHLYYVKGCFVADDDPAEGSKYFDKAVYLFELQENHTIAKRIKEVRKKLNL